MPTRSPYNRLGYLPFNRGYVYRSASTQASEMDRNLMFYYEHMNLYDPRQASRLGRASTRSSGSDDEARAEQRRSDTERLRLQRTSAPPGAMLPPSPPRTPSPTSMSENDSSDESEAESDVGEDAHAVATPDEQPEGGLVQDELAGQAAHDQSIHRGDTSRQGIHQDATSQDMTHQDETHRGETQREETHQEETRETHQDTTHQDAASQDIIHQDATHKDQDRETQHWEGQFAPEQAQPRETAREETTQEEAVLDEFVRQETAHDTAREDEQAQNEPQENHAEHESARGSFSVDDQSGHIELAQAESGQNEIRPDETETETETTRNQHTPDETKHDHDDSAHETNSHDNENTNLSRQESLPQDMPPGQLEPAPSTIALPPDDAAETSFPPLNSIPEHQDHDIHRLSIDAPPSYHPPTTGPPSYLNHHTTTLLESNSNCPPALTENLRRFLLFSLAIDYDLVSSCPETLDQADWLPFLRLARHWTWRDSRQRYMQGYDPVRPAFLGNPGTSEAAEDDERALRIEQCIFAVVVRPAIALGVPADIATTTLRQFPTSITSSGTHLPLHHRYRSPSIKALATKLLLDREILFDTITQHSHQNFRSALHEANERIEKQHFVRLRSPDDYELTQFGLMREKLEGSKAMEGLEGRWARGLGGGSERGTGRKRFSRWVRKLSSG